MKNLVFAFFLSGLAVGCGSSCLHRAETSPEATTKAQVRADDESGERQPSPAALSPDQVQAVVADWQTAQNTGKFAAYATLYAAKFEGIKRIGARAYSYDRAGWLEDRKRMFEDVMNVSAEEIDVATPAPLQSFDSSRPGRLETSRTWDRNSSSSSGLPTVRG